MLALDPRDRIPTCDMEASELVHVARYALQLFGTLQGRDLSETTHRCRYQTTHRGRGARALRALARPHPPMLELTRPLGPLHQQPANLVRAGEQVVAAFGPTSFTGRRTLLHRRASGFLLPLGRGRRGSRVNARRALARGHVRLRQLHSTNTALRSPYLAARCFACLA